MESAVRKLLEQADDCEHAEWPRNFDRSALLARAAALKPVLERIANREFVLDDGVEDASFFAELSIRRAVPEAKRIDTVFALSFSNFGDLFTAWSRCEAEQLPDAIAAELVAATERGGLSVRADRRTARTIHRLSSRVQRCDVVAEILRFFVGGCSEFGPSLHFKQKGNGTTEVKD